MCENDQCWDYIMPSIAVFDSTFNLKPELASLVFLNHLSLFRQVHIGHMCLYPYYQSKVPLSALSMNIQLPRHFSLNKRFNSFQINVLNAFINYESQTTFKISFFPTLPSDCSLLRTMASTAFIMGLGSEFTFSFFPKPTTIIHCTSYYLFR